MNIFRQTIEFFVSLKGKLIISVGITLVCAIGFSTYYISQRERARLLDSSQEHATFVSHVILKSITKSMMDASGKDVQDILSMVISLEDIDNIWILNEEGRIVRYAKEMKTGGSLLSDFSRMTPGGVTVNRADDKKVISYLPINNDKMCWGCHDPARPTLGYLAVQIPIAKVEKEIALTRRFQIILAAVIVIIVSGVIIFLFSKFINAPLTELSGKMSRVQSGDLKVQVKTRKKDELGRLGEGFNTMVQRLREASKEIKMHHQEQLERADRLANLGELAAGAAHEINNPAGIILTRIGYLLHHAKKSRFSKSVIEDLQAVEHQTYRISKIVKGLLNFSKATSFFPHNVCLNEIIEKLLLILEPRLKHQNVKLFKNLVPEYSEIYADPGQIEQVILNIINNAIDSMPSGGNLVIKTDRVNGEDRDESLRLSVLDTGVGIAKENLDKIFSPFFTTKEEGKGTGLGLSISYGIIKTHGGRIEVKSEVGKGSEFCVYLPLFNGQISKG